MKNIQDFKGLQVIKVFLAADHSSLIFKCESGIVGFRVEGDCCSYSWIEHLSGLSELEEATIQDVERINMPGFYEKPRSCHPTLNARGEYVKCYGIKFYTDKGSCLVEFRNDSNGYYGGYIVVLDDPQIDWRRRPLLGDF